MSTSDNIQSKIYQAGTLPSWDEAGTLVFTNGCFDVLHFGHLDYLGKSADLGDKLIIGLNTDSSVQRLKGPNRPINNQDARAQMLAALSFVDAVILFEEDTPYQLIQSILPNILVKGADYAVEEIVGHDLVLANGGRVIPIDLVAGYSSSLLIEKMKNG